MVEQSQLVADQIYGWSDICLTKDKFVIIHTEYTIKLKSDIFLFLIMITSVKSISSGYLTKSVLLTKYILCTCLSMEEAHSSTVGCYHLVHASCRLCSLRAS